MRSVEVSFMGGKKQKLDPLETIFQLGVAPLEIDPPIRQ